MAVGTAPLLVLLHRLSRPGECRLRQATDEYKSGAGRFNIRPRRRIVLHRLFSAGSAVESGARPDRGTALDRLDHDHLGGNFGWLRLHPTDRTSHWSFE